MRNTWEEHAMLLADVAMLRSEDPYQKVGASILGHNNEVISVSYNGLAAGFNPTPYFWDDRSSRRPYMLHAETNALSRIKTGEGKILACTLLPCSSCATNIAAHGIKQVVFREMYDKDQKALEIFKFYGIECKQLKL